MVKIIIGGIIVIVIVAMICITIVYCCIRDSKLREQEIASKDAQYKELMKFYNTALHSNSSLLDTISKKTKQANEIIKPFDSIQTESTVPATTPESNDSFLNKLSENIKNILSIFGH